MRTILAIATALAMTFAAAPTVDANETVSYDYIGGGARVVGAGLGLSCHDFCLGENNPFPGTSWGGSRLYASSFYTNAIISIADDVYGGDAAFSACFWNPDGDNICDAAEDYPSATDCGVRALTGSPFAGDYVTAFTYVFAVTEDLDACGASSGTLTASFF